MIRNNKNMKYIECKDCGLRVYSHRVHNCDFGHSTNCDLKELKKVKSKEQEK